MHWYVNTEIEDVHVVLDCHLQLGEWGHLHDGPSWVDGEEGGSSGVGHEGRVDGQLTTWDQTKTGERGGGGV